MSIPLAILGSALAALIETSALPDLTIAGAKPDLVLVLALTTAILVGVESGLAWAFVGGLMLDAMLVGRPLGTTALANLLAVGLALVAMRPLGTTRFLPAVAAAFLLTFVYQGTVLAVLLTTGVTPRPDLPQVLLTIAVLNAVTAALLASVIRFFQRRLGLGEWAEERR